MVCYGISGVVNSSLNEVRRFVFKSLSYLYVSEKNGFLLHKYPYTSEGYATAVVQTFVF